VNISLKEPQNVIRKYSLTMELLIFKYRRQNIAVAITVISAVTGPAVTFAYRTTLLPTGSVKTMQLFTRETPDIIAPTAWPASQQS